MDVGKCIPCNLNGFQINWYFNLFEKVNTMQITGKASDEESQSQRLKA